MNVQGALERVHAFFLIERDREQDRFHGIVVALVSSRLGVAARAMKEAIEKRLVLAPQRPPEFCPVQRRILDQLNKCRNRASHEGSLFSVRQDELTS